MKYPSLLFLLFILLFFSCNSEKPSENETEKTSLSKDTSLVEPPTPSPLPAPKKVNIDSLKKASVEQAKFPDLIAENDTLQAALKAHLLKQPGVFNGSLEVRKEFYGYPDKKDCYPILYTSTSGDINDGMAFDIHLALFIANDSSFSCVADSVVGGAFRNGVLLVNYEYDAPKEEALIYLIREISGEEMKAVVLSFDGILKKKTEATYQGFTNLGDFPKSFTRLSRKDEYTEGISGEFYIHRSCADPENLRIDADKNTISYSQYDYYSFSILNFQPNIDYYELSHGAKNCVANQYTFTVRDEKTGSVFDIYFDFEDTDYRAVLFHRAPKELESKCRELKDDFVVEGEEGRFEVYESDCG